MKPPRRPPNPYARESGPVVVGAVALRPAGDGQSPDAGDGAVVVRAPADRQRSDQVDLHVTDAGLIVGPAPGTSLAVPSLHPWSSVVAVDTVGMAQLPDGSSGRVLEVELADEQWRGNNGRVHFASGLRRRRPVPRCRVGPYGGRLRAHRRPSPTRSHPVHRGLRWER